MWSFSGAQKGCLCAPFIVSMTQQRRQRDLIPLGARPSGGRSNLLGLDHAVADDV